MMRMPKMGWKTVSIVIGAMALLITAGMTAGINDAGFRTVVQYPTGTVYVKFSPGPYLKLFGSAITYPDVMTMDFDKDDAASGATINQSGIPVRYRDGGMGTIYGNGRFNLPNDSDQMIRLHKEARGDKGLAYKILKPTVEEAATLTAGLMTSEEGYDGKRAIFTQWAKSQLEDGPFITISETIAEKDEVTGKIVTKQVAKIKEDKGIPQHYSSVLKSYGITVVSFPLNNPEFEPKTMDQIALKRKANMDIITAKANAEKAKQDAITAEETGKADVMKARYEEEVTKERAVVNADREKQVAEIQAAQRVAVAAQAKAEAEQEKLRQGELKEANILEGQGLAEKNRLIMESDGALDKKIAAVVEINAKYAAAMGQQKWVPEVQMGQSVSGDSSAATDLIKLLTTKAAKELAVDLKVQ